MTLIVHKSLYGDFLQVWVGKTAGKYQALADDILKQITQPI